MISKILQSFSRSIEQFCLTVGQNNFGNKIPKLSEKKVSAPILIPKLDLGFGSQYRNHVLVAHYSKDMDMDISQLFLSATKSKEN